MTPKSPHKGFSTSEALDFLLLDLLEQIKIVNSEEKEASYTKLIELFFKGVDLREKFNNTCGSELTEPQINFISGLNNEKL